MRKKTLAWFRNSSLRYKIVILVFAAGVLPIGIVFMVSLTALRKISVQQQLYTWNQGYTQVFQSVEDRLDKACHISTLLAVNHTIQKNIILAGQGKDLAEQLTYFADISSSINDMEMTFESGDIVLYVDRTFLETDSQTGKFRSEDGVRHMEWYRQLQDNNGRPVWVQYQEELSGKNYVSFVRKMWNQKDFSQSIGVLAILFDQKYVEEMLVSYSQEQMIYLESADGVLLASNTSQEQLVRLPLGERAVNDRQFGRKILDGKEYLVCSRRMEKPGVYLVSLIPAEATGQLDSVSVGIRIIYVVLSLCILLAILPLTRSITRRIQLLKEQMMQIQRGIIAKVDIKEEYQDEIGQLITHYNEMAGRVQELMQEQYELGQKKTEAELKAVQSQIHPHFLYNTLDMINWMAQKNETDNIRDVVQAMSRFYRMTLSKGHDIVSIGDETKMCEAYMEIQRRRYRGRILYEVEVEEEILPYQIPKITLQPFLENAIVHGINEKEEARGIVRLDGWMEDGRITLSVTDDGYGMGEPDKNRSHFGSGYGMENIAQRLELFYGEQIPIQVESSLGIGTCVIINIPAVREEREG